MLDLGLLQTLGLLCLPPSLERLCKETLSSPLLLLSRRVRNSTCTAVQHTASRLAARDAAKSFGLVPAALCGPAASLPASCRLARSSCSSAAGHVASTAACCFSLQCHPAQPLKHLCTWCAAAADQSCSYVQGDLLGAPGHEAKRACPAREEWAQRQPCKRRGRPGGELAPASRSF